MRFSIAIVLLATGFGFFACKPIHNASQVKVVSGQPASLDGPARASTVGLVTIKDNGSKGQVFCTGVLIASDAVVTSTQCLESAAAAGVNWGIYLDHPKLSIPQIVAVKTSQNFAATGARDYPSLNLSVLRLAAPLDPALGYVPVEILRNPAGLQASTELLIAGYGRQNSKCLDVSRCSGVLLEAKSSVHSFQDQNHLFSTMMVAAKQDQGSVCFGDAGGPAFVRVNGQYFLASIASGSLRVGLSELSATRNDSFVCENGLAAFTFPGDYLSWMDKTLGLKFAEPSAGNLARSSVPALENTVFLNKPVNPQNWAEWLTFNRIQDPAFATVSFLQQKLLSAEAQRTDAAKLSDLDFYRDPVEAGKRVQALTELKLKVDSPLSRNPRALTNIEPLAAFTGLTRLEIESMAIADFSPMASLSNLSSLRIVGNGAMPRLDAISNLSRLQSLELDQVGTETLRDIDASRLAALKTLTIVGNGQPIFIPRAPALDTLIISNADLSNANVLAALPATLTSLKITGSKVNNASFLTNLPNLKSLDLSGNLISDFTRVGDLKKLVSVVASGNPATSKVCGTPAAAVCEYNQITSPQTLDEYCINYVFQESGKVYAAAVEALAQSIPVTAPKTAVECADLASKLRLKRKLELIGTGGTSAVDLSPIASIRSLNNLSIRNFGVIDVTPLQKLINVDILDLSQNLIIDPKPLEVLPELVELNLSRNLIANMNGFSHPTLRRLVLDGNRLAGVSTLGALPELRTLSCANMPGFKDVKGVGRMGKLKQLNVGKTDVTDLQTLEPSIGLEIDAPEEAVKNGCPVLLGSCVSGEVGATTSRSGPVPGLKPGQRVQGNPTPSIDLPGLSGAMKLQ